MGLFDKLFSGQHGGGHGGGHGNRSGHGRDDRGSGHNNRYPNPVPPSDSAWGRSSQSPATTLKACGACNATNDMHARFCQQCGASVAAAVCAGCNTQLAPDAKFCGQCGKPRAA